MVTLQDIKELKNKMERLRSFKIPEDTPNQRVFDTFYMHLLVVEFELNNNTKFNDKTVKDCDEFLSGAKIFVSNLEQQPDIF